MVLTKLDHIAVIIVSLRVLRRALDIFYIVSDSNIVLIETLLQVEYTIIYELTALSVFLQLIRIDVVV